MFPFNVVVLLIDDLIHLIVYFLEIGEVGIVIMSIFMSHQHIIGLSVP